MTKDGEYTPEEKAFLEILHEPLSKALKGWLRKDLLEWMAEILLIVRELAEMEPEADKNYGTAYCRICGQEDTVDREGRPGIIHEPDCLWLRAQKFKEKA